MSSKRIAISYIILNWKTPENSLAAVKSIRQQASQPYEIIIVDNESSPGGARKLKVASDLLITNSLNLGFAAACNQAARSAKGKYLAFVNSDALLPGDWSTAGLELLKVRNAAASVSGGEKISKNTTYSIPRVSPWTGMVYQDTAAVHSATQVPYSYGSNLLIDKKKFWLVGGFEESYFAYYEDLDLGAKLMSKGWTSWYLPNMTIAHKPGSSTGSGKSTFRNLLIQKNKYRFIARHYSWWWLVLIISASHDAISFAVKSLAVLFIRYSKADRAPRLSVYSAQLRSAGWAIKNFFELFASRRKNKDTYTPEFRRFLRSRS